MGVQTTYSYTTPKGVAGGLLDISPYSIDSRINEETDEKSLRYGMGAVVGTSPGKTVLIPSDASTAAQFEGIVLTGFNVEQDRHGEVYVYPKQTVGILKYGGAWARVAPGLTIAYGDPLYLVIDGDDAGLFSNEPTDAIAIGGRFVGGLGTGNIAPVELYNQGAAIASLEARVTALE
jgi:hypothetical protein